MKRLIYVMGSGRSGSTLMDVMLGNANGILSCGELRRFVDLSGAVKFRDPASPRHQFWSGFRDRLDEVFGLDFDELKGLTRDLEYHTAFLKPGCHRASSNRMRRYRDYVRTFFDVLSACTDSPIIVDSSKYPGRLLALRQVLDIPVQVIYLVRHPVGVVRSFAKQNIMQPSKGFLAANAYYFVNSALCTSVYYRIPPDSRIRVRYRDLVTNPVSELERIERHFGLDLTEPIDRIRNGIPLSTGCLYDGNRLRLEPEIVINSLEAAYGWSMKDVITRVLNRIWY